MTCGSRAVWSRVGVGVLTPLSLPGIDQDSEGEASSGFNMMGCDKWLGWGEVFSAPSIRWEGWWQEEHEYEH